MATRQQKSTLVQHSEDRSEPVLWNCQQTYCMISWVVTQHCRETRIQTNRMHCLTYSKIFGFLGSRFSHYKTSLKHTPEVHAVRAVSKHLCLWEKQASTSVLTWYRLHTNHNFSTSIYILLIPYWRKIFHRHHANYNMIVWDLYSLKTSICTTHQTPLKRLSHRSH